MSLTMVVSSLRKGRLRSRRKRERESSANTENVSTLLLALYISHTLIYTMALTT
jgi:hypothetical protein